MDMLRWPTIQALDKHTDIFQGDKPPARFIIVMESNGADPAQRDPLRLRQPGFKPSTNTDFQPGTIYREDVSIPWTFRNDPEYIANEFARAWGRIWQATVAKRGVAEAREFIPSVVGKVDSLHIDYTPHALNDKHLYMRPGRFISVNGPRRNRWQQFLGWLHRYLRGHLRTSVNSGVPSAPPTPGTETTESA